MKVIALGGAGAMGRLAVRDLSSREIVTEITIADYNLDEAANLARLLGKKCRAVKVDANDHSGMVAALRNHDAALGAIGPFYKYEAKVARACIDAGVHYVSICDDYDAAEAALQLDAHAKEKGLTMITGVGWTPGVTNILAKKASRELDAVEGIAVCWGCHASDTVGKAVTLHTLHIFAGKVPSFQSGQSLRVPAGSGHEIVRFPQPVGDVHVYHLGHPEPVTIPRYIKTHTVTLKGGLKEHYFNILGKTLSFLGILSTNMGKDIIGGIVNPLLPLFEKLDRPPETASACRVDVTGTASGRKTLITYGAVAHMDLLTGLPASIALQMILENKIKETGVMGPEACLDPGEFLQRLAKGGIRFYKGAAMSEPLSV